RGKRRLRRIATGITGTASAPAPVEPALQPLIAQIDDAASLEALARIEAALAAIRADRDAATARVREEDDEELLLLAA
ncbi:hypothetical protein, partial [Vineibacter terrae]|uniref:hypothetical protein n=1 Tax=Vineibacter terrae TaxID=2586908 RepID=UPI002E3020BE